MPTASFQLWGEKGRDKEREGERGKKGKSREGREGGRDAQGEGEENVFYLSANFSFRFYHDGTPDVLYWGQ